MCSIQISLYSGPAFISRSARLVNNMNHFWLSALVLQYPNPKIPTLVLFPDDIPYDTLNCLKCSFCYRGIHKQCVLDTSLAHICLRCIESSSKKTLDFEEDKLSTVRITVTKKWKWTVHVYSNCIFFWGGRGGSTKLHYFVPVLTASSNPQKRWRLLRTKHAPARHHTRVVCYGRECLSTSHQMVGSGTKLKTFFILTAHLQQIQSRELLKFCTPSGIKKSRSWICVRTVCVFFLYNFPFSELPITTEQPSSR